MPIKIRLLLFSFFVALFFILLPVCLVYSLGYRLNTATHRLERLGMLSIRTTPEEASIVLNQKLIAHKTPARIANLFPGSYNVSLSRRGYRSWEGTVRVRPNWVTQLETVNLFPNSQKFHSVSELIAERAFLSGSGRKMIVYGVLGEDRGLWLLDLFSSEEILILSREAVKAQKLEPVFRSQNAVVHWSRNERALIIQEAGHSFFLDLKKPNQIIPLNRLPFLPGEEGVFINRHVFPTVSRRPTLGKGPGGNVNDRKRTDISLEAEKQTEKVFRFDRGQLLMITQKHAYLKQASDDIESSFQEVLSFPSGWQEVFWDRRFKQLYFIQRSSGAGEGGTIARVDLAQGALSKLIQNMRQTVSEGFQLLTSTGLEAQ